MRTALGARRVQGLLAIGMSAFLTVTMLGTASPSHAADTQITLNSSGGTGATDGIRVSYQSGQWQIKRNGTGQLYHPDSLPTGFGSMGNGTWLTVSDGSSGETVGSIDGIDTGNGITSTTWDSVDTTGPSSSGSGSFTSDLTAIVDGLTYVVHLTAKYTAPNSYFTQTYTVDIPAGNTKQVRLYTGYDTYLSGGDAGAGFYNVGPPIQVGVTKDVIEALQYVSGPAWAGYASRQYRQITGSTGGWGQGYGTDYPDSIDPDPTTDNGIGVNWSFGSTPGTTAPAKLLFTFATVGSPGSPQNPVGTPGPNRGEVTVSWDPPASPGTSAIESYTATASPGGASCTAVAPATSCVISGLDTTTQYTFSVTASNASGSGTPSSESSAVTPSANTTPTSKSKLRITTAQLVGGKVRLTGTTKGKNKRVTIYRATSKQQRIAPRSTGPATKVGKTTSNTSYKWAKSGLKFGGGKVAYFCAREGSKLSNTVVVKKTKSSISARIVDGDLATRGDYLTCK